MSVSASAPPGGVQLWAYNSVGVCLVPLYCLSQGTPLKQALHYGILNK